MLYHVMSFEIHLIFMSCLPKNEFSDIILVYKFSLMFHFKLNICIVGGAGVLLVSIGSQISCWDILINGAHDRVRRLFLKDNFYELNVSIELELHFQ